MADITRILNKCDGDDPATAEALMPLIYDELRQLAAQRMARMPPGQTIQATVLVHEAYLKLVQQSDRVWQNRRHFYNAAAKVMRQFIIDRARSKRRFKHGGDQVRAEVDDLDALNIAEPIVDNDLLLALDEALTEFERVDPDKAQIVRLKFYIGLTEEEIADQLEIGERTVKRHWSYARAWLFERAERIQKAGREVE